MSTNSNDSEFRVMESQRTLGINSKKQISKGNGYFSL